MFESLYVNTLLVVLIAGVILHVLFSYTKKTPIVAREMPYGFLANHSELVLPAHFYAEFSHIIDGLKLSNGHQFRKLIDDMHDSRKPIDYYKKMIELVDERGGLQYVYSVFTFICQKYVRCLGKDDQIHILPYQIGIIWHISAQKLGLPEATTYASVVLYNWRSLVDDPKTIDDIEVTHTITQTDDEAWFYKIHMAIELSGSEILQMLTKWNTIVKNEDIMFKLLTMFHQFLENGIILLHQMKKHCRPDFFWGQIRIYLAGYDDVTMFPNGLGIENTDIKIKWAGGSGAQSTLLQMTDAVFGVKHDVAHAGEFLQRMRSYMPPKDRDFLLMLEANGSIEKYVKRFNNSDLTELYNKCISELNKFRQTHISIVHTYVWNFIKKRNELIADGKIDEADEINGNNVSFDGGSGSLGKTTGANDSVILHDDNDKPMLITFLKKFATETLDAKI